jgi:hypothetical protein
VRKVRKVIIKPSFVVASVALSFFGQITPADASPVAKKYKSIASLKAAFIDAGGQCWEWKIDAPATEAFLANTVYADCDAETRLIFYKKKTNVLKESLESAKLYRSLRFKINMLVGPNWVINSDQVKLVQKKLGGTLITR